MGWWTDFTNWAGDTGGDIADGAGDLWNDVTGKTAARGAAKTQMNAAELASKTQLDMFNKTREDQAPFLKVGQDSINKLSQLFNSGEYNKEYGPKFSFQEYGGPGPTADPGFQFRIDTANKALSRSAAAKGGALGGGQLRALSGLNQNLASQEYQNAYGRYANDRQDFNQNQLARYGMFNDSRNEFYQNQGNQFNRLASLAGIGQSTANGLGNQRENLGRSLGENVMAGANANAAGIVGGYNSQRDMVSGVGKLIAAYYGMG